MSAASYRNIRDRRSILLSGSISHRPALVERLYWFPRPPERERSKPPNAAGARFIPCQFRWPTPTGTDPELKWPHEGARSSHGPLRPPRLLGISGQPSTPLCARSRSREGRGSRASKAVSMTKRDGRNGVLMSRFRSCTLCHQRLPDSHDRAHRVVIPHTLAYAPISADVDRAVSRGDFREDIQEDFEVQ